jgi:hypothetical protein
VQAPIAQIDESLGIDADVLPRAQPLAQGRPHLVEAAPFSGLPYDLVADPRELHLRVERLGRVEIAARPRRREEITQKFDIGLRHGD